MTPIVVPLRQALSLAALAGRGLLVANLSLRVAQAAFPLLGLLAMKMLLDAVAAGMGSADPDAAFVQVAWAVAFAAGVAAAASLLGAVAGQVGERHSRRVADRCATLLQRHGASLDLLPVEDPANADLLHRAGTEAAQRPVRVVQNLAGLVLAVATLVGMASALATVSLWLPLLAGVAVVPQVLVRLRHVGHLYVWQQRNTEAQREVGYLAGLLLGRGAAKDLRLYELAPALSRDVANRRDRLTDEQLVLQRRRITHESLAEIFAALAMFLAYLYLGAQALAGAMTIGGLVLYVQAVQRSQNGIRDGLLAYGALREDRLFLAHVFRFFALQPRVVAPAQPRDVPQEPVGLTCAQVGFAYPRREPVLHSVDLELRPGERVALLGENGAGKSTLVRLLCRLCDPDAGSIRFGDTDLKDLDPVAFRRRLSVLFQDAAGFERTVRQNLVLDGAQVSDEDLLGSADLVGIGDMIRQLPKGLDTRLGRGFAGGFELSGGQWRRLLLARALIRRSPVLILDEPFAFLDPAARQRLTDSLAQSPRDHILLLVDHRPETLQWVDRVVVLDRGRIVHQGPPAAGLPGS
ncbi:MAG: ABC transporter ATP-binding protein [Planctomycetota bacterium]|nr:ABC transporter ATP-binding protein [Planctomycetota bacterium]